MGGWSEPQRRAMWQQALNETHTPSSLAQCMLCFESHILAERLSDDFLAKRKTWRSDVDRARSFPDLVCLGLVLQQSLRLPSTLPRLTQSLTHILDRQDLAIRTLDFVVGHKQLCALFEEALVARTSAPEKRRGDIDIGMHCSRSRNVTNKIISNFSRASVSKKESFSRVVSGSGFDKLNDGSVFFTPEGEMSTEFPERNARLENKHETPQKSSEVQRPLGQSTLLQNSMQDYRSTGSAERRTAGLHSSPGQHSPSSKRKNMALDGGNHCSLNATLLHERTPVTAAKIGRPELSTHGGIGGVSKDEASPPYLSTPTVLMLPSRKKPAFSESHLTEL